MPDYRLLFSGNDFRALEQNMRQVNRIIGSEIIGDGAEKMAETAADEARAIVRVDTGLTRESIRVFQGREPRNGEVAYYIFAGLQEHRAALFLELGTVKMQPYPFLRPALQRTYDAQHRGFVNAVKRGFNRLAARAKSLFGLR